MLVLTRQMGHKNEMPGLAQWRVRDRDYSKQSCWICDQEIYCLIFWSKTIGKKEEVQVSNPVKERLVEQILEQSPTIDPINVHFPKGKIEPRFARLFSFYLEDTERPLICGEFTAWEPVRMVRVDEFAQGVQR